MDSVQFARVLVWLNHFVIATELVTTRAMPDRDVFYVAHPIRSIVSRLLPQRSTATSRLFRPCRSSLSLHSLSRFLAVVASACDFFIRVDLASDSKQSAKFLHAQTRVFHDSTHRNRIHGIVSWNGDEVRAVAHYHVLALTHNLEAGLFERPNRPEMINTGNFRHR